jgi:hypothetical protein
VASAEDSVDDIRRQMAEIRSQLHRDMSKVVGVASIATDWRTYVRDKPWVALGAAFALGYVLVPRRERTVISAPATLAAVAPSIELAKPRSSLLWRAVKGLGGLAVPVALRAAQGYTLRWVEDYLANHPPGPLAGGLPLDLAQGRQPRDGGRVGYPNRG